MLRGARRLMGEPRGAVLAEYAPLIVVIAVLVVAAASFLGPWVVEQLMQPTPALGSGGP